MPDNRIRFRRLGYVCLNVTDIVKSSVFYRDIVGLELVEFDDHRALLRCSDRYFDVMLCVGETAGLNRIGWQMESAEGLAALRASLEAAGHSITEIETADAQQHHIDGGFSTREPTTGARLDFFCTMEAADAPFVPSHTKIVRIGHVVIATPDIRRCAAFFEDELNFKTSDRIGDVVVHMRCFPNPLHHSFGIGAAPEPRFHHLNFMVTEVDDIGKANVRMEDAQVPIVFGPGRHPQSDSLFFYFLDPDGLTLEYSFGMEEFPETGYRPPRDFPLTVKSGDHWGGRPRPGFASAGTIQAEPVS